MSTHAERSDPNRREHFVYRVFDDAGRLLYVGCTMRPRARLADHRASYAKWLDRAASVRMVGPTDYATARQWEREALRDEYPAYGNTPQRQSADRRSGAWIERRIAEALGPEWDGNMRAFQVAADEAIAAAKLMDWGATPEGQWPQEAAA